MRTYPQSTLEEIIDSERAMLLDGPERYGQHYKHARAATMYFSLCIASIERDRAEMFGRLFSLMKKHHTLSFFSTLRLHRVQAMMDLRQVLEAGAAAAFAIAHPDTEHFVDVDAFGIMDPSQKLTSKRYKWLEKNYRDKSEWVSSTKGHINSHAAHANIISGDSTFRMADDRSAANAPFFDIEDEYFVRTDLWLTSSVAITLMDLLFGVASDVARTGRAVVEFRADFQGTIQGLASENAALQAEIQAGERYQKVMQDIAKRQQGRGAS
ncbi:hypothetical protein EJ070_31195 [Mesorhizobium sp. M1E.F.Ca.ET.045.02.1.1]|uniref:hypothetical protein n=1 Tax=unclassified Mesorhizobium TaxID=325217 RepID=UPI000F756098|nr:MULTISPECIES: hypothetical protein [unclassified Mesorhizobium]AZO24699.1 hypothetical protein EJ070_31195 [Mesorhizobium sp. M1E.F.Ca.ET.045.02.1.1]RUW36122.1 hypothetical protein EOA38_06735 [Mesorhizobium sp. M1E.F.Ca.ET.041.01.1.1]RUW82040.1 hypothetical protein EOA29_19175 [Mesorhizobium sp. M1E.F.Ca.ET.063.01.1.1]RWD88235.1 MAG: hypothetical protein EOS38_15975 [Mesorhizobium sp.]